MLLPQWEPVVPPEVELALAVESAHERARRAMRFGQWQTCEEALTEALAGTTNLPEGAMRGADRHALNARLHARRCVAFEKQGRSAAALADADATIAAEPRSAAGFRLKGRSLLSVDRYADAASAFDLALGASPYDGETKLLLQSTVCSIRRQRSFPSAAPRAAHASGRLTLVRSKGF